MLAISFNHENEQTFVAAIYTHNSVSLDGSLVLRDATLEKRQRGVKTLKVGNKYTFKQNKNGVICCGKNACTAI